MLKNLLNTTALILIFSGAGNAQVPLMSAILGPASVCSPPAQAMSYTASASNAPTSYSWSTSPSASVVISNQSAQVTSISFPNTNSSYTVYCSATNSSGTSNTVLYVVTVYETPTVTFSGATIFCQGSGTSLSASPTIISASSTLTYNWTPSTGLSSTTLPTVNANPPSTTTYTVLLAIGSCTNTAQVTVTVIGTPSVSAVVNPVNICPGKPATLTVSGSAVSYSIFNNQVGTSTIVNPNLTTNYIVGGTGSNGCRSYTTVAITVMPSPTLTNIINPQAICSGQSSTITASGNGLTYSINGVPGTSSVVSPPFSATYTIGSTAANGCTASVTAILLVTQSPVVSGAFTPANICEGQAANLNINGTGLNYFLNGTLVGSFSSVNPTVTTTYTLSTVGATGCTNTTTATLPVTPKPVMTAASVPSVTCKGETSTLSVNGTAVSYTVNGSASPGTFTISPALTQTFNVTGAGVNNCISQIAYVHTVSKCTGISEDGAGQQIVIYPNPNAGAFYIRTSSDMDVIIYNQFGQAVRSIKVLHDSENVAGNLAPGIYFIVSGNLRSRIIVTD